VMLDELRSYGSKQIGIQSFGNATFDIANWPSFTRASVVQDRRWLLVADLRLDNRHELEERVGSAGPALTDEELVLAAWAKARDKCLDWIAGDFALAIFDRETASLYLARDPSGQTPLFYARLGPTAGFATMPSGLRPLVGRLSLNRLGLAQATCNLREDDERSLFEGIDRVLAGELVTFTPGGIQRRLYWNPPLRRLGQKRSGDWIDEYRHLLDEAVAARIRDYEAPIGTHLSSGWDSTAVTTTAAIHAKSPSDVIAFTSAPKGPTPIPSSLWRIADESEVAARTAAAAGVRHAIVREMPPLIDVMRAQSRFAQEPSIYAPNIAWLIQLRTEAAQRGVGTMLTGYLGNITLNVGGLYALPGWLRNEGFIPWLRQAALAARRPDTHWRGVLFNSFSPWTPEFISAWLHRKYLGAGPADHVSFLRPEWRGAVLRSAGDADWRFDTGEGRAAVIRKGEQGCLRKGALAAEGIDERDVMSDRRIIEFSLNIPPQHLYCDGVSRPLARAALAGRVPDFVLNQPVRGLQAGDWASRFTQRHALEALEEIESSSTAVDLFDLPRMRRAIDAWPTAEWNTNSVLGEYRLSLIGGLAAGIFALEHERID